MKKMVSVKVLVLAVVLTVVCMSVGFIIAETNNKIIYAAYNKVNGAMRYLQNPSDYNSQVEIPISWNIQGPAGPKGEAGTGSASNSVSAYNPNGGTPAELGSGPDGELFSPQLIGDQGTNPSVTVNVTNGAALVSFAVQSTGPRATFMITGATEKPAYGEHSRMEGYNTFFVTGLNNGLNTFTLVYHGYPPVPAPYYSETGTVTHRYLSVTPIG